MKSAPEFSRTGATAVALAVALASLACAILLTSSPSNTTHAAPLRAGSEYIRTYAADCVTPQTVFDLGDTVCAEAGDFPLSPDTVSRYRRFQWAAPDSSVADRSTVKVDPQQDVFVIPTSGDLARPGRWRVMSVDVSTDIYATAYFTVRDPSRRLADLHVQKTGPQFVLPGERIEYRVKILNDGPDMAESVEFVDDVPRNMTFVALRQGEGAFFDCAPPKEGETGRTLCKSRGLRSGEEALFSIYYKVDDFVEDGWSCESSVYAESFTEEMNKEDNFHSFTATVSRDKDSFLREIK